MLHVTDPNQWSLKQDRGLFLLHDSKEVDVPGLVGWLCFLQVNRGTRLLLSCCSGNLLLPWLKMPGCHIHFQAGRWREGMSLSKT